MTKTAKVDIVAKIEGARGAAMLVAVDVLQAAGIQPGATVRFHLTRSPFCSSALAPDTSALQDWKFAPLFEEVEQVDVPAVTPRRIVDPTGVGDAFRGGLMKGLAMGLAFRESAQMGSVAATYALEHLGGTSHAYTWDEFKARYEQHFGAL